MGPMDRELLAPPRPRAKLSTPRGDVPVGPVELLIIQPSPFCNINCRYCYLPDRSNAERVTVDTIRALVSKLRDTPQLLGERLTVSWHAGEPLVVPVSHYEQAFALIREQLGGAVQVTHSFQTNATLIDARWLDLFERERLQLGLSLDGPEFLHDTSRVYRSGKGTHRDAMRGVALLQRRGIPFSVIAVVTRHTLAHPDAFYDFFRDQGIARVALNIEEVELHNTRSTMTAETQASCRAFLARLFERSLADNSVRFRELNAMRNMIVRDDARPHRYTQLLRPFGVLTCDYRGNVSTFSPELCGALSARYGNFTVGNVHSHSLQEMLDSHAMQTMLHDIQLGVDQCERSCGYFALCGGGAPANKFFEHGTFATSETMHCKHSRQAVIDVTLERLEVHARVSAGV